MSCTFESRQPRCRPRVLTRRGVGVATSGAWRVATSHLAGSGDPGLQRSSTPAAPFAEVHDTLYGLLLNRGNVTASPADHLFPEPALRAAQRAFIASESRFRPAAEIPLRRLALFADFVAPPRRSAQRALAAAAILARDAADIGRRLPVRARVVEDDFAPPPKREVRRRSRVSICSRIDNASLSFSIDKSIGLIVEYD